MATVHSGATVKINSTERHKRGPLVRVELAPGRYAKMYRSDVEDQGMQNRVHPADQDKLQRPQKSKVAPPQSNKLAAPTANKLVEPRVESEQPADFTTIKGIGLATARALVAHGITTFEQLRQAGDLSYLASPTVAAIEKWRNG